MPRRMLPLLLLLGGVWVAATGITACSAADASPDQPIAFSHLAHANIEVDCTYCHEYVDRYNVAGMPPVETCSLCHFAMEGDHPEMAKIFEYEDAGEEIPWVRLYELPNYTHFSHKWHVRAEIGCETCHGDIGQSVRATRHMVYEMDWCVTCHEETEASIDCVVCHK